MVFIENGIFLFSNLIYKSIISLFCEKINRLFSEKHCSLIVFVNWKYLVVILGENHGISLNMLIFIDIFVSFNDLSVITL